MRYLSLFRILPALLLALLLSPVSASAAPESVPLKTGWLGEYEAFPVWYAREQGWDKEEYLDHLCMKAGLPPGTWRREGARIETFTGEAWRETTPRGDIVRREDIGHRDRGVRQGPRRRGAQVHRGRDL